MSDDLIGLARNTSPNIKTYSIVAIGALRPRPESSVALLIEILNDEQEDERIRAAAAYSLALFREHARPAHPSLVRIWNSSSDPMWVGLRGATAEAMLDLSPMLQEGAPFSFFGTRDFPPEPGARSAEFGAFLLQRLKSNEVRSLIRPAR